MKRSSDARRIFSLLAYDAILEALRGLFDSVVIADIFEIAETRWNRKEIAPTKIRPTRRTGQCRHVGRKRSSFTVLPFRTHLVYKVTAIEVIA